LIGTVYARIHAEAGVTLSEKGENWLLKPKPVSLAGMW
jgi:hypothetical protein